MKKTEFEKYPGQEITEVRKVIWDMLWHVYYKISTKRECYMRVDKKTALKIANQIENEHRNLSRKNRI